MDIETKKEVNEMGTAKLNVWIRDENCKIVMNPTSQPGYDWVEVRYAAKPENGVEHAHTPATLATDSNVVAHVPLPYGPKAQAHVEIVVPPGLYIIAGHICTPNGNASSNIYTDKAIVIAKSNEVANVDLIIPEVGTCAHNFYSAFIDANARLPRPLPEAEVVNVVRTMLQISNTPIQSALTPVSNAVKSIRTSNVEDPISKHYKATLNILKKIG
jgi:hypothetical protein